MHFSEGLMVSVYDSRGGVIVCIKNRIWGEMCVEDEKEVESENKWQ